LPTLTTTSDVTNGVDLFARIKSRIKKKFQTRNEVKLIFMRPKTD